MHMDALKRTAILISLLIVLLGSWLQVTEQEPFSTLRERLDFLAYDLRLNLTLDTAGAPHPDIVIVDIDEHSLTEQGRWPWSRATLARLVQRMSEAGAAVIAFDMVFAEPERNPATQLLATEPDSLPTPVLDYLHQYSKNAGADQVFAASLSSTDAILGMVFHHDTVAHGAPPPPLLILPNPEQTAFPDYSGYTQNIELLRNVAAQGFVTVRPDNDGVVRRVPLLLRSGSGLYPSLSLETARHYFLADSIGLVTAQVGTVTTLEALDLAGQLIPTDASGTALIPYQNRSGSFRHISATDILQGRIDPAIIEDRILLVGTSALALADLRPTPIQAVTPGVDIHAHLLAGILDGHFPYEPSWALGANLVVILLLGGCLAFIAPLLGPIALIAISIGVALLFGYLNIWLWSHNGLALDQAIPLLTLVAITGFNAINGFLQENHRRQRLKTMFGQYVPPPLVEEMSQHPDDYNLKGETREMSVLFADIRNFTTLSESLSATELTDLLNRYFTPMTKIIFDHRGTIDKYVGDMIMAFWGAPLNDEQHAEHAIHAALAMLRNTAEIRQAFLDEGLPEINIGIGINSGAMSVGDMGSIYRRAYTVLGDSVNLASRLEGITKYYGVPLVVGERTRELAPDFIYRQLDRVRVKGKHQAVSVFEPVCHRDQSTEALHQELKQHQLALDAFWQQRWEEAHTLFSHLASAHPDTHLYQLYLERIELLKTRNLPHDWDGVFERREK